MRRWKSTLGVMLLAAASLTVPALRAEAAPFCAEPVLNVVAHEDDDIIFMSPDPLTDVTNAGCVTTVYLTAGDAGNDADYWQGREAGAKAAYATMAGADDDWDTSSLPLPGRSVSVSTLSGHDGIALIFLRLPDGFDGSGSDTYGRQSLQKLWDGTLGTITSVDGKSSYTRSGLLQALTQLMDVYRPRHVRVQDYLGKVGDGDHSDHHAAAYFGFEAQKAAKTEHRVTGYRGYPVSDQPANVSGGSLTAKLAAFYAYAANDPLVDCRDDYSCEHSADNPNEPSMYHGWLRRQYTVAALPAGTEIRGYGDKCLDVRGPSTANGTPVQMWDCVGVANQRWRFG